MLGADAVNQEILECLIVLVAGEDTGGNPVLASDGVHTERLRTADG